MAASQLAVWLDPFTGHLVPMKQWSQFAVDWATANWRPTFQIIKWPIGLALDGLTRGLLATPPTVLIALACLFSWQFASASVALFVLFALLAIGYIGVWPDMIVTLAIISSSVTLCVLLGVPLGILAGRSERIDRFARPVLDVLQTLPAFVYLVPIVMLIGIGNVPGVVVTVFFALPPIIRLTSLGIRSVPESIVEAGHAFGSSEIQILTKIQIPLAIPTILAGLNQTLMMALAMVVYASMISVEGLGQLVLRGIGRLDMGLAAIGGIGIVLLAMILDRITQGVALRVRTGQPLSASGPIALGRRVLAPLWRSAAANGVKFSREGVA